MLGRRGFFGALAASPLVAKTAFEEAAKLSSIYPSETPLMDAMRANVAVESEPSWLNRLREKFYQRYYKAKEDYEFRRDLNRQRVKYMPEHIKGKKSWSPAFKQYINKQEQLEAKEYHNMDIDEAVEFLIKRGYNVSRRSEALRALDKDEDDNYVGPSRLRRY